MKSRTSYFNGTVLRKDITRFAPIWGIYSVILLLYLLGLSADRRPEQFAQDVSYVMPGMAVVNGIYAGVVALFLFGDLFNPRLCNALHALPMKREGWFLTHCTAGVLFCIVPNTLAALLAMLWLGEFFYLALLWLAVTVLQYLFFFGVGVLSATCAGNRLGMAAIYGIINLAGVIVFVIVNSLFMPAMYGIHLEEEPFLFATPIYFLAQEEYIDLYYDYENLTLTWQGFVGETWLYLFVCAAIGLALTALAVLVYRKRKLEHAADFMALKPLSPFFLVIYTLGVGVICYELGKEVGLGILFLIVGLAVGYFTGRMFLERKVNVFKPKAFLGFGIFAVALGLLIGLTWLDPIGITRYVPEDEDIECIHLYDNSVSIRNMNHADGLILQEPAELAELTAIHESLVTQRRSNGELDITLIYELKDGSTVARYYPVLVESAEAQALKPYFSRWEYVFNSYDWAARLKSVRAVMVNNYAGDRTLAIGDDWFLQDYKTYSDSYYLELEGAADQALVSVLEAIRKDCEAGNMAQPWAYYSGTDKDVGWIELHLANNNICSIRFTTDASYTVELIDALFEQATKNR